MDNENKNPIQKIFAGIVAIILFAMVTILEQVEGCYRQTHEMSFNGASSDFDLIVIRGLYDFDKKWPWVQQNCDLVEVSTHSNRSWEFKLFEIKPKVLPNHFHCPKYALLRRPSGEEYQDEITYESVYAVVDTRKKAEKWLAANGYKFNFEPATTGSNMELFEVGMETKDTSPWKIGLDGQKWSLCTDCYFWYWNFGYYLCYWRAYSMDRYVDDMGKNNGMTQKEYWKYLLWLKRNVRSN